VLAVHGGAEGIREESLLHSVLAGPLNPFAHGSPDTIDLAAKCTAGIVQNHSVIDGNKRTRFVVGVLFLELNGYRFTASEESAAQAVLELAGGTIDAEGFSQFLRVNVNRA
jgi:death-on-curing protein